MTGQSLLNVTGVCLLRFSFISKAPFPRRFYGGGSGEIWLIGIEGEQFRVKVLLVIMEVFRNVVVDGGDF